MESSLVNQKPIFLTQSDIKFKFEQLEMLPYLHRTCIPRKVKQHKRISTSSLQRRHYTAWQCENFIDKKDGKSRAIVYWRRTLEGEEEYTVEQFTAPDGTFYTSDAVANFELQSAIMKADENTPGD